MKRFFYFFIVVLGFLISTSAGNAQGLFDKFKQDVQAGMEKAKGGISADEKMPFGKVRLASCKTGFKNLKGLLTGVEVSLDNGWILKEVHIFPIKNKDYNATVWPVFNTKKSLSDNWKTDYINNPVFPIWLEPLSKTDITLNTIVDFRACHSISGICHYFSGVLDLELKADEAYTTNACGALNHSLKTAAVDIDKTAVKVEHQLLENNNLKIRLTFPKDVETVEIQSPKDTPFKEIFSKIDQNVFTGILSYNTPINIGDTFSFNIRSSNGCYIMKIKVENKNTLPPLPQKLSWWCIFWTGLIFFLLSPAWCFWLSPQKMGKTATDLRKKIRLLQLSAAIGLMVFLILWIFNISMTNLLNYQLIMWGSLILSLYLLIKPIQPIWVVGVLIVLLPKPFWDIIADIPNKTKIWITFWCFICLYLPLNMWLLFPKNILKFFNQVQKGNDPAYPHVVRFPYWILLGWIILMIGGQIYFRGDKTFDPKNTSKPAIVRVTNPTCLGCLRERAFVFSTLYQKDLPIYQLNSKDKWAQQKKNDYQIRKNTFNLLLMPDGKEIVLPEKLNRYHLKMTLDQAFKP